MKREDLNLEEIKNKLKSLDAAYKDLAKIQKSMLDLDLDFLQGGDIKE
jgi:hypothetical protein